MSGNEWPHRVKRSGKRDILDYTDRGQIRPQIFLRSGIYYVGGIPWPLASTRSPLCEFIESIDSALSHHFCLTVLNPPPPSGCALNASAPSYWAKQHKKVVSIVERLGQ